MGTRARHRRLDTAVAYWRSRGFPFPTLSQTEIGSEFNRLARVSPRSILRGRVLHFSCAGLRLANAFHPQMWTARPYGHHKSPVDYFSDDEVLRAVLLRAVRHWPNRRCWNGQCLRTLFRIYGGGRVANFRPSAARALIDRYSRTGQCVLDFSAGYGGRLLGAVTLPRHYLGLDADPQQYAGLRRLWASVSPIASGRAELANVRAEEALCLLPERSIDLILSSPPYYSQERYSSHPSQSAIRYSSYPTWKREFLAPILTECCRVMRRGGYLILNVKDTRRFPVASDTLALLEGRLALVAQLRLSMRGRPCADPNHRAIFGSEPVLVYQRA
jgi:SAM-dependent methyltransferase